MKKEEVKKIYDNALKDEIECLNAIEQKSNLFSKFSPSQVKGVNEYVRVAGDFFKKCDKALQKIEQEECLKEADKIVKENTPLSDAKSEADKQIKNLKRAVDLFEQCNNTARRDEIKQLITDYKNKEKLQEAEFLVKKNLPIKNYDNYHTIKTVCDLYRDIGYYDMAEKLAKELKEYDSKREKEKRKDWNKDRRRNKLKKFRSFFFGFLRALLLLILPIGLCAFAGWILFAHAFQIRIITGFRGTGGLVFAWVVVTLVVLFLSFMNLLNIRKWDENKGSFWTGTIIFTLLCGSMYPYLIYKTVNVLERPYNISDHVEAYLSEPTISTNSIKYRYTIKNNTGSDISIVCDSVAYINDQIIEIDKLNYVQEYRYSYQQTYYIAKDKPFEITLELNNRKFLTASQEEIGIVFFIKQANGQKSGRTEYYNPYNRMVAKTNDFIEHTEENYNQAITDYNNGDYFKAFTTMKNMYSYKESADYRDKSSVKVQELAESKFNEGNFIEAYKYYNSLENSAFSSNLNNCVTKQKEYANNLAIEGKIEEATAAYQALADLGVDVEENFSQQIHYLYIYELVKEHKFNEAKEIIDKVDGYKPYGYDFTEPIEYTTNLAKQGKIEEAITAFEVLKDMNANLKETEHIHEYVYWTYIIELIEHQKFSEAKEVIAEIGDYRATGYNFTESINYSTNLAKQGKIEEAITAFEVLRDLGASLNDKVNIPEYVNYTYAVQLVKDHKYTEAKNIFLELGSYKDSVNYYLYECDYQNAVYLYEQEKYDEAEPIFVKLGTYQKSATYLKGCKAQAGVKLFNEGKYAEAYEIFYECKDSDVGKEYKQKIEEIAKEKATEFVTNGQFNEAYEYLNSLGETYTKNSDIYSSIKKASNDTVYTDVVKKFSLKKLIVPEGVEVLPYRSIQEVTIDEVVLPSTLKELGNDVFLYSKITKPIHIPEGVTKLGDHIFTYMKELKEVYIPSSVEQFGIEFFRDTNGSLQKIHYSGTKDTFLSKTSLDARWLDGYNKTGSVLKIVCTDYTYYYLSNEWTSNN